MKLVAVATAAGSVPDAAGPALRATLHGRARIIGSPKRLFDRALELPFEADVAPRLALAGLDVNVVPAAGRAKRILIADMDSTMIGVECIDELADFAGVKPQVAAVTERAMRGELDFEEAIDARVGLLKDLPLDTLQRCHDERVRLNPGAEALVRTMIAHGARTALVSGGFTFFTERVAAAAGFDMHRANTLLTEGGCLTGAVARPVLGRAAKAEALAELCVAEGVGPEAVVAIGDGANDIDMLRAAGLGVAYRAKPALRDAADAVLDRSDLSAVLALQGLSPRE